MIGQVLYAGAIHRVEQAKIDANRRVQKANNEKAAAESELQRFSAGLANRRLMDAAGSQMASIEGAIARNIDAKAAGDFQGQIALAEELGRTSTMAASAGVGGSSVESYNQTVRLAVAMQQDQQDRAFHADTWAAKQDVGNTLEGAVAGMDNNQYRANLDLRRWADHKKMGVFERIATVGLAAAATYFGGPQAGMAVIGMAEGNQAARNGDFDGASAAYVGAVQNGISAYSDTRKMGGKTFWSKPKAPVRQVDTSGAVLKTAAPNRQMGVLNGQFQYGPSWGQ